MQSNGYWYQLRAEPPHHCCRLLAPRLTGEAFFRKIRPGSKGVDGRIFPRDLVVGVFLHFSIL